MIYKALTDSQRGAGACLGMGLFQGGLLKICSSRMGLIQGEPI